MADMTWLARRYRNEVAFHKLVDTLHALVTSGTLKLADIGDAEALVKDMVAEDTASGLHRELGPCPDCGAAFGWGADTCSNHICRQALKERRASHAT